MRRWVTCAAVANQRLRRWDRLQRGFQTLRTGLAASRPRPEVAPPQDTRVVNASHQICGGEGTSSPRRNAASAQRQFEKRPAGVPIRARRDSTLGVADHLVAELIVHWRSADPSGRGDRQASAEGLFFRASGRGAADLTCQRRRAACEEAAVLA